jgi:dihydroneopterin aldolase
VNAARSSRLTLLDAPSYPRGAIDLPGGGPALILFGGNALATIRLEGLSVFGHHGARPYEKEAGQRLEVDLVLEPTNAASETSDRLGDTIDYDRLYQLVREIVEGKSYHLLEALARATADTILERFPIRRVMVRIAKQNLGWTTGGRAVIEVTRERQP